MQTEAITLQAEVFVRECMADTKKATAYAMAQKPHRNICGTTARLTLAEGAVRSISPRNTARRPQAALVHRTHRRRRPRRLHGRPKARNAPFPSNTRRFPSNQAFAPRYSECAYAPPLLRIRIIIPWRKGKLRKQTANRAGKPAKSRKLKGSQRFVRTQAPCRV